MARSGDPGNWEELEMALARQWEGVNGPYSREVKVSFCRHESGEVSLFSPDIDNVYNDEKGWRWEIFLNKDGTWRLA